MPAKHVIDGGILHVIFEGSHSLGEDLAALSTAFRSPELVPGTGLLLDLSGSLEDRTKEEIMSLAAFMREGRGRVGDRSGILVSGPLQYGLARMLAAYAEPAGMKFSVFTDASQARRWLRPDDEPDQEEET